MSNRTLTFTIGIPARNGEAFLAEAIASALAQTRPADEVLVVDDASSDATRAIANCNVWQGRVRYVYNETPTGFADAFNRLAGLARSEFVVFLSADDVLDPDLLESLEDGLLAFPEARFCYAANRYIDATGKPVSPPASQSPSSLRLYGGQEYVRNYLMGCLANQHLHRCLGFAVERRLLVEECSFRKEAGILADEDLFIRLASRTRVVGISSPRASVRMHRGAISSRLESLNLRVAEDYLSLIRFLRAEPHHIAEQDIAIVNALAYRSIALLLHEAVLRGRKDLCSEALHLIRESMLLIDDRTARRLVRARGGTLALIYGRNWATAVYRMLVSAADWARRLKSVIVRGDAAPRREGDTLTTLPTPLSHDAVPTD